MKTVIIAGSARNDGDTHKMVSSLSALSGWDIIDLNDYQIGFYDYARKNKFDDFLPLMENIIANYDAFVFATPVYWYSMSANMKIFFDRLTDLVTVEKDLGRKLRGKKMAVITSSVGDHLGDDFWLPFARTASYLGIEYLGNLHTIKDEEHTKDLAAFINIVGS
ncbi:multimeric flavodoxin WrbA [Flavobacterium arsenatis]|uniref:Multimeric flavodoxin WrbA n=1 Tax=Flavobacterium arsenatis TaxID=1484332 RepID=A0ABU1TTT1_9FLAO|nr:NAD(P)H-dependent oxidoreductase [Flavobacterium arsenatis]MDR6969227.1 multimeric flavodoxin WrbA [Flavobacterium arsenatis]